ncbi:MAG: holo-[acyl-carrier-protein] synthase [Bacilli bacterium]|nr:holo-[acyl-carrier-protein] synthase [Bacilli bacterium]
MLNFKEELAIIFGIGMDLLEIKRTQKILAAATAERFLQRILTPSERQLALTRKARLAEFVSGRFAAKEAIVKAFGCGVGPMIGFQDIEILPDSFGKPLSTISQQALSRLGFATNSLRIHLSITHTETTAAAYAIVEQLEK